MMKRLSLVFLILLLGIVAACDEIGYDDDEDAIGTDEWHTETFSADLDDAETVIVEFTSTVQAVTIDALNPASNLLIDGEAEIIGELNFDVNRRNDRTVELSEELDDEFYNGDRTLNWTVGINQTIPAELDYTIDAGSAVLTLDDLDLEDFDLTVNAGTVEAELPESVNEFDSDIRINAGEATIEAAGMPNVDYDIEVNAGSLTLDTSAESAIEIEINAGVATIVVPEGAPVRLTVEQRNGGQVDIAIEGLVLTEGTPNGEAVYETENFSNFQEDSRVDITLEINAGVLTVR